MQTGALSVEDKEALGAQVLRHLDMERFRACFKRSYLDGLGASIAHAHTTIEEARRQNLANQEKGSKRAAELKLTPEPKSMWSEKARMAFESNLFAPDADPQDAMVLDVEAVVEEYKYMKGRLQENVRQFAPMLYSELPETTEVQVEILMEKWWTASTPHSSWLS